RGPVKRPTSPWGGDVANTGGGSSFDASSLVASLPSTVAAVGGDVDADGRDDLVTLCEGGRQSTLQVHRNVGGQALTVLSNGVQQPLTFGADKLYLADGDRDGDLDLHAAAGAYGHPIRYWFIPNTTHHLETKPPLRVGGTLVYDPRSASRTRLTNWMDDVVVRGPAPATCGRARRPRPHPPRAHPHPPP